MVGVTVEQVEQVEEVMVGLVGLVGVSNKAVALTELQDHQSNCTSKALHFGRLL